MTKLSRSNRREMMDRLLANLRALPLSTWEALLMPLWFHHHHHHNGSSGDPRKDPRHQWYVLGNCEDSFWLKDTFLYFSGEYLIKTPSPSPSWEQVGLVASKGLLGGEWVFFWSIRTNISTFGSLAALELESGYLSGGQLFQGAVVNFREVVHKKWKKNKDSFHFPPKH